MSVDELMKQYSGAYDSDFEAELADMSCGDDSTPDDTEDEEEEEEDESSEGRSSSSSCSFSSCFPVLGLRLVTRHFAVQLVLLFSSIAPCWVFFNLSSSSAFLRSVFRQLSYLSCGLPCFLRRQTS